MGKWLNMTNIKIGFAFVLGWFCCGLLTPQLIPNVGLDPQGVLNKHKLSAQANTTLERCNSENSNPSTNKWSEKRQGNVLNAQERNSSTPSENNRLEHTQKQEVEEVLQQRQQRTPKTTSRCELLWEAAARCRRPPFKPFDTSRRANHSCLSPPTGGTGGGPPPVVVIAALPRSGSSVLRTALEFATGVKCVGQAAEGQCNPRQFAFVETTFPFRKRGAKAGAPPPGSGACAFWLNKNVRAKPKVGNVWGVVVVVRHPYKWLDEFFGARSAAASAAAGGTYERRGNNSSSSLSAPGSAGRANAMRRRLAESVETGVEVEGNLADREGSADVSSSTSSSSSSSSGDSSGSTDTSRSSSSSSSSGKNGHGGEGADALEAEDWDSFLVRHSHLWRSFVEHWLLAESGPLWEQRGLELDARLFVEGPRPLPNRDHLSHYSEDPTRLPTAPLGLGQTTPSNGGGEANKVGAPSAPPPPRYFLVRYESLIKDPSETALSILDWSKEAVFPDGKASTQSSVMERAERCVNYGNAVGRLARTHAEPAFGFGPRFRVGDGEHVESPQWARRKVVFDHTMPYLCAFSGYRAPKELSQCPPVH